MKLFHSFPWVTYCRVQRPDWSHSKKETQTQVQIHFCGEGKKRAALTSLTEKQGLRTYKQRTEFGDNPQVGKPANITKLYVVRPRDNVLTVHTNSKMKMADLFLVAALADVYQRSSGTFLRRTQIPSAHPQNRSHLKWPLKKGNPCTSLNMRSVCP